MCESSYYSGRKGGVSSLFKGNQASFMHRVFSGEEAAKQAKRTSWCRIWATGKELNICKKTCCLEKWGERGVLLHYILRNLQPPPP